MQDGWEEWGRAPMVYSFPIADIVSITTALEVRSLTQVSLG